MLALLCGSLTISFSSAFSHPARLPSEPPTQIISRSRTASFQTKVDLSEFAVRDVSALQDWAYNYGVQQMDGFELTSDDGLDVYPRTNVDAPAGSSVLYVPANLFLTSYSAREEFGVQQEAEKLIGALAGSDQFPLFYLFLKVLNEYNLGEESPWYPWLSSLPRVFNNGASMTPTCYDCLPPLAAKFSMQERVRCINCRQALKDVDFIDDSTKKNEDLLKWVYNVVETRSIEMDGGERVIIPMFDMFNHCSAGHEIEMSFDESGSAVAYTTVDVPAGSPLHVSYGNYYLTNPSATFAKYGFIDESCPSTFCKMMDIIPSTELRDIGLSFSRMLFYNTGEVSEEVYDVLLYQILSESKQAQKEFYNACVNGDYETKQAYHNEYMGKTIAKLKDHVDKFLKDLQSLSDKTMTKDVNEHPRLPLIMAHNELCYNIFMSVKSNIDPIAQQYSQY